MTQSACSKQVSKSKVGSGNEVSDKILISLQTRAHPPVPLTCVVTMTIQLGTTVQAGRQKGIAHQHFQGFRNVNVGQI